MASLTVAALLVAGSACASSSRRTAGSPTTTTALPAPTTSAAPGTTAAPTTTRADGIPQPAHVVVVIEENHAESEVIGRAGAPYLNSLASQGALFTQSFATNHPSQPNYLTLLSGSSQGVTDDSCPPPGSPYAAPNLAAALIAAGRTFVGYSEDLPAAGSTICSDGDYARKHNPWVDFSNVPSASNQSFSAFPTSDYARLPTVSFVVPNLQHDMHDGTVQQADTWLAQNLGGYVRWARTHDSLLVVTWDEDDESASNHIPTIFVGPMVRRGPDDTHITHLAVLATLEAMYGLPPSAGAARAAPITTSWR